jgi:hypothetical protein
LINFKLFFLFLKLIFGNLFLKLIVSHFDKSFNFFYLIKFLLLMFKDLFIKFLFSEYFLLLIFKSLELKFLLVDLAIKLHHNIIFIQFLQLFFRIKGIINGSNRISIGFFSKFRWVLNLRNLICRRIFIRNILLLGKFGLYDLLKFS